VLVAGSPLRLYRLGPAGVRVAEAIERGADCPAGHEPLTDRWVDAGAAHPLPRVPGRHTAAQVTAVVPVHDEEPGAVARLVGQLQGLADVVVVDDASQRPVAPLPGARLVRLAVNRGPGGARNAGLAEVATPFVLFADVGTDLGTLVGDGLALLLAHLDRPGVALVAPRVVGEGTPGPIGAYEEVRSPLDLGDEPARVRAGTRVSYVPAAVLLARSEVLRSVGGFDESLRFGEDVDLLWRLDQAGWHCRFEPAVVVRHRPRLTLGAFVRQRRAYGSSAAPLARRHRGALAPVRTSGWSAAVWGLVATGHPLLGAAAAAGTTAALAHRLRGVPGAGTLAVRLAGLGHLHAGRLLASALTRAWWPPALAVALVSRRARRVLVAAALVPAAIEYGQRRPRLDPLRYVALRVLDDVAYGWGLWQGCWRERELGPLVPDLRSWPGRAPAVTPASAPTSRASAG
jgi:mycofactocin system glycosyltransferase